MSCHPYSLQRVDESLNPFRIDVCNRNKYNISYFSVLNKSFMRMESVVKTFFRFHICFWCKYHVSLFICSSQLPSHPHKLQHKYVYSIPRGYWYDASEPAISLFKPSDFWATRFSFPNIYLELLAEFMCVGNTYADHPPYSNWFIIQGLVVVWQSPHWQKDG